LGFELVRNSDGRLVWHGDDHYDGDSHPYADEHDDTRWIAPDASDGGPPTFFVTGTETDSFPGQSQSYPINESTGIPAFTVHRPLLEMFGIPTRLE
jgi:hypothetical protein